MPSTVRISLFVDDYGSLLTFRGTNPLPPDGSELPADTVVGEGFTTAQIIPSTARQLMSLFTLAPGQNDCFTNSFRSRREPNIRQTANVGSAYALKPARSCREAAVRLVTPSLR